MEASVTVMASEPDPKYPSLGKGQIRLVTLLEPPSRPHQISCEITVKDLSNLPSYNAISYTWGSEDRDHYISWSTRKLWVTKSCFRACQQMVRFERPRLDSDVVIWIDQLSIDQANDFERSKQIELMGEIYWNAHTVTVFLGDPDSLMLPQRSEYPSSFAENLRKLETLQLAQHALQKSSTCDVVEITSFDNVTMDDVHLFKGLVLSSILAASRTKASEGVSAAKWIESLPQELCDILSQREAWQGLLAIFERTDRRKSFFRRRWILQETRRLSSWCYISRFRIPILTLVRALKIVLDSHNAPGSKYQFTALVPQDILSDALSSLKLHSAQASAMLTIQKHQEGLDLFWLLNHCRTAECSDPRDAFYALRSLVSMKSAGLPLPSYQESAISVIHQHLIYFLRNGRGATMIQKAGLQNGQHKIAGTPSWCPPWLSTNTYPRPYLHMYDLHETQLSLWFGVDKVIQLRAGGARGIDLKWSVDGTTLTARGALIGRISTNFPGATSMSASPVLAESDSAFTLVPTNEAACFAQRHTMLRAPNDVETLAQDYDSYLVAERERLLSRQRDGMCSYYELQMYLKDLYKDGSATLFWNMLQLDVLLEARSLLAIDIEKALLPAFLGATSLGPNAPTGLSVVGIGPRVARDGDVLVVFDGFETATVLRQYSENENNSELEGSANQPCEPTYQVVGDAHLMQLADGELLEQANVQSQMFVLI